MKRSYLARVSGTLGLQGVLFVLLALEQLLLLPVFLSAWGTEAYRDWLVVLAATELLGLLDWGMQAFFSNGWMASWAAGQRDLFRHQWALATAVYALLVVIAGALVLAVPQGLGWIGLDLSAVLGLQDAEAAWIGALWLYLGLAVVLRLPIGVFGIGYRAAGVPERGQLFHIVLFVLRIALVLVLLMLGFDALVLAQVMLLLWLLAGAWLLADLRSLVLAGHWPRPCWPSLAEWKSALKVGSGFVLQDLGSKLSVQGMVLLLAQLLINPVLLLVFTTTRSLTGLMRQSVNQLGQLLAVEMARAQAADLGLTLGRLQRFAVKVVAASLGAGAAALWFFGEDLMAHWTHGLVAFDPWLTLALLGAIALPSTVRVLAMQASFSNRPHSLALAILTSAVLSLLLTAWAVPRWGPLGAGLALLLSESLVFGLGLGVWLSRQAFLVDRLSRYLGVAALALLGGLLLGGVSAGLIKQLLSINGLGDLVFVLFLWAVSLSPAVWWGVLERYQRERLAAVFRTAKG